MKGKHLIGVVLFLFFICPSFGQDTLKHHIQVTQINEDTLKAESNLALNFGDTTKIPTLNHHRFINNQVVIDPFTKTSFRMNMGYGNSNNVSLPSFNFLDSTYSFKTGSLVYANLSFQLDARLKDWVAFYLNIGASARVGVEPRSLYTNGLNTILAIRTGWKIRLLETKKHFLSTLVGVSNYDANITDIAEFINDLVLGIPTTGLGREVNVLQTFGGLHYAYGINSVLGLQITTQYNFGDLFEEGKLGGHWNLSTALDINLHPKTRIPIGVSLAYGYITIPDYTAAQYNTTSVYNGKLAYTGAGSFLISIDVTSYKAAYLSGIFGGRSNTEVNVVSYSLNMLIYFN